MIDHHDALLSKLIDDAFYGRPLIAVTGVEGAGKTTLARRFAQQFANEAECIALKASDFKNRDDFIQRLVSKLSPDSVEYAADTPLNTIVDYAGSLADQERLLVLIVDDAESLSDAFLETLYELIDEADEASLCCLLLGDPALKDAIERADPNGGIEDFSWFDLPKLEEPERPVDPDQPIAATATATITAQNLQVGYITSTSGAATTITLPITTTAGAVTGVSQQMLAVRGQQFSFIVDNTGGANNVTIALGTGGSLSDAATIAASAVAFGRLVVASGATGMAQFTMMFTGGDGVSPGSATGYTLTRTA